MHSKSLLQVSQLALLLILSLAAALLPTPAAAQKASDAPSKWAVVKIRGELKVLPSGSIPATKKRLDAEWKEAVKQFEQARKDARKENTEFTESKPEKPQLKVVKNGFKSAEEAEAALQAQTARVSDTKTKSADASYVVLQVGTQLQVVEASMVKSRKAEVAQADQETMQAYEAAKKAAKKDKQPFDQSKPKKTLVKVVKKFASEEEAKAHMDELRSDKKGSGP